MKPVFLEDPGELLGQLLGNFLGDFFERGIAMAIIAIVVTIAIAIGLFFLVRAITCWYFKINQAIKQLKLMNDNLARIAGALEFANSANGQATQLAGNNTRELVSAIANAAGQVAGAVQPAAPAAGAPITKETPEAPVTPVEAPAAPVEVPAAPVAKVCPNCGSTLSEDAVFCVNCGTKVM
ncbi:MAG: zinc-ribbon domain-containing protein [Lachnospiraceae bacterium]